MALVDFPNILGAQKAFMLLLSSLFAMFGLTIFSEIFTDCLTLLSGWLHIEILG